MRTFLFFIMSLILVSCSKDQYDMNEFHKKYGDGTADVGALISELTEHQIIFGHKSVGSNILEGIRQWEQETGVELNLKESRELSSEGDPAFVHFSVGDNKDTKSKIDDFVSVIENIPEDIISVAFFKFCYVDIIESTDIDSVFGYYKSKMHYLKDNYPNCNLVLLTVPLTGIQKGLKATAKRALNRPPAGVLPNIKRHEFNELLRNEFSGVLPIYDLAGVESTRPDGATELFKYKGSEYPCMPDFYKTDM